MDFPIQREKFIMHSHESLIEAIGPLTDKPIERFKRLSNISGTAFSVLQNICVQESWGKNAFALKKLIAIRVLYALEEKAYTVIQNVLIINSGLLTEAGFHIFLLFKENNQTLSNSSLLFLYGVHDECSLPYSPSSFPFYTNPHMVSPSDLSPGSKVAISYEHILDERNYRLPFLEGLPRAAQKRCIDGALAFSIRHAQVQPYWYLGRSCLLVPIFLTSEDVTQKPDIAVALEQVNEGYWKLRTWLQAEDFYPNARAGVTRVVELQPWILTAWNEFCRETNPDFTEEGE